LLWSASHSAMPMARQY